ncbi:hypothetical protein GCM10027586_04410 [Kineococcus gypseus]|uniref:hypothetical protein n=1 Tax=Kineococcus gypseus TaxID=1637102 RepID=UPI003D7D1EB0
MLWRVALPAVALQRMDRAGRQWPGATAVTTEVVARAGVSGAGDEVPLKTRATRSTRREALSTHGTEILIFIGKIMASVFSRPEANFLPIDAVLAVSLTV